MSGPSVKDSELNATTTVRLISYDLSDDTVLTLGTNIIGTRVREG